MVGKRKEFSGEISRVINKAVSFNPKRKRETAFLIYPSCRTLYLLRHCYYIEKV